MLARDLVEPFRAAVLAGEVQVLAVPARTISADVHEAPSAGVTLAARLLRSFAIIREKGLADIEALLEQDMLNHYQANKPELNFLL